jgi:hypothetical protein
MKLDHHDLRVDQFLLELGLIASETHESDCVCAKCYSLISQSDNLRGMYQDLINQIRGRKSPGSSYPKPKESPAANSLNREPLMCVKVIEDSPDDPLDSDARHSSDEDGNDDDEDQQDDDSSSNPEDRTPTKTVSRASTPLLNVPLYLLWLPNVSQLAEN